MAQAGDSSITVQVTQTDIDSAVVSNDYGTSVAKAVVRQVTNALYGGFSPVSNKMSINGEYLYDLDVISVAFCNLERVGIKVTVPFTATLTASTI